MWCADGLCSLSYVLCLRMRCLSVSWWVQKLRGVAERSWEHFRIITTVSMEKRKQKVTAGENQIKGKVITGLTSAGSVSVCPGCPWSFSWWIWNHRCVFVCVHKQGVHAFLNNVLFCLGVLFCEGSFAVHSGWAKTPVRKACGLRSTAWRGKQKKTRGQNKAYQKL